jgi:DNA polymerase-4
MDAFFASIEQLDHPELRGKPILVGGDGPRGVVTTASYEARPYGCHSAQPMAVAKRLCPHAIVVPTRFQRYREISDWMFEILESFTPQVQPLSIDEAFLDVTGTERLHGSAIDIAGKLKARVKNELFLTISVGVAPNKFLAKLASDLEKPDGLTVITPETIDTVLPPLPVSKIWGIGPKTAKRLDSMLIRTIGDLRRAPDETLRRFFGKDAGRVRNLSFGRDEREVVTDSQAKQISHEQTFGVNVTDPDHVRDELIEQVEQVARRLRRHRLLAGGVTVKIRFGEFQTITRSRALCEPTDITSTLWEATREAFDSWALRSFQPVRLIGMAARSLCSAAETQMPLFADESDQKSKQLDRTLDKIVERFGRGSVQRASGINRRRRESP